MAWLHVCRWPPRCQITSSDSEALFVLRMHPSVTTVFGVTLLCPFPWHVVAHSNAQVSGVVAATVCGEYRDFYPQHIFYSYDKQRSVRRNIDAMFPFTRCSPPLHALGLE